MNLASVNLDLDIIKQSWIILAKNGTKDRQHSKGSFKNKNLKALRTIILKEIIRKLVYECSGCAEEVCVCVLRWSDQIRTLTLIRIIKLSLCLLHLNACMHK